MISREIMTTNGTNNILKPMKLYSVQNVDDANAYLHLSRKLRALCHHYLPLLMFASDGDTSANKQYIVNVIKARSEVKEDPNARGSVDK